MTRTPSPQAAEMAVKATGIFTSRSALASYTPRTEFGHKAKAWGFNNWEAFRREAERQHGLDLQEWSECK